MQTIPRRLLPGIVILSTLVSAAQASQPLETESARLIKRGHFLVAGGFEFQTSNAGTEAAAPFAFEYGLMDRLELTVEPVFYTSIHDNGIPTQTGPGDTEATLTGLVAPERAGWPAFALAGEVKLPTAHNSRIGTGEMDYSAFLIASKRRGAWDTHANVGYTIIGQPQGVSVNNVASFALAEVLYLNTRYELVGEVFGSGTALKEGGEGSTTTTGSAVTPELGGGELVGALGLRFHPTASASYSLGLSLDNQGAFMVHPGVLWKW